VYKWVKFFKARAIFVRAETKKQRHSQIATHDYPKFILMETAEDTKKVTMQCDSLTSAISENQ